MIPEEQYMQRCLELAGNGLGSVAPNPMVGAVLVHDGKIIGEGFHQQFGKAHAEVNAINDAVSKYGEEILQQAVLYVNLEPCSHTGKTPPCCDLIIAKKIPTVVIGTTDPFSEVNGEGIRKLKEVGIMVIERVLEIECMELNKRFFTFHQKQRPYILLKFAQSKDGFIAAEKITSENKWITNEYSLQLVHKWRSEEQAIMIGTNTALVDNPSLTVRDWRGKNPTRIVIDRKLKLNRDMNLFDQSAPTLIYNEVTNASAGTSEFIKLDFDNKVLHQILNSLYEKNIQSVLVEGGAQLIQSFIDEHLWDEARIFTGNNLLGNGLKAPTISGKTRWEEKINGDQLILMIN